MNTGSISGLEDFEVFPICRSAALKKGGWTLLLEYGFGGGKGGFYFVRRSRDLKNLLKGLKQACKKSLGKSYRKPCFLLTSEPFRYLAERFNPCHGNHCDNPLPLLTKTNGC
ncbi:hypothetical protein AVEN_90356-1 [Araneus ventricosus]|uniref:Uncharacterized protein n=1 Tax=Araneus ventricosus TaxID=182803 RepID=A0A4Y2X8Y7_ARAVE|nr:hypothetical protein AVEN_90356-1 [Araneus ventricosus]